MPVYQLSEEAEKHYRGAGWALAALDTATREVVAFVYVGDMVGDAPDGDLSRFWVNTPAYHRTADRLRHMGYVCSGMLSGRTFTELF